MSDWRRKDLSGQIINNIKFNYRLEDYVTKKGVKRARYNCTCMNCGYVFDACAVDVQCHPTKICGKCQKKRNKAIELMKKYGFITPIELIDNKKCKCICDCGNEFITYKNNILTGKTKSCGCMRYKLKDHKKDITGIKVHKLTAIKYLRSDIKGNAIWLLECECGNTIEDTVSHFLSGSRVSCGCSNCKISSGELKILKCLEKNNVKFIHEYKFEDLRYKNPLRFDFALLDDEKSLLCLIEYQGEQHYINIDWGKQQREITDKMKQSYCIKNKIKLYEIKYTENIENKIQEILNELHDNTVLNTQETA